MKAKAIFTVCIIIISLGLGYLFLTNAHLKKSLEEFSKQKESEFSARIQKEKEFIRKDLEQKYQADIVSYQAMAQRLEMEKQRSKELEAKLSEKKDAPAAEISTKNTGIAKTETKAKEPTKKKKTIFFR
jgi:regulatory protein YycI of two-component signal transduction system YycFG